MAIVKILKDMASKLKVGDHFIVPATVRGIRVADVLVTMSCVEIVELICLQKLLATFTIIPNY